MNMPNPGFVRTQVVDRNGRTTHVWRKSGTPNLDPRNEDLLRNPPALRTHRIPSQRSFIAGVLPVQLVERNDNDGAIITLPRETESGLDNDGRLWITPTDASTLASAATTFADRFTGRTLTTGDDRVSIHYRAGEFDGGTLTVRVPGRDEDSLVDEEYDQKHVVHFFDDGAVRETVQGLANDLNQ